MKVCSKCQEAKPLAAFSAYAQSRDGRYPSCKACQAKARKLHYQQNTLVHLQHQRQINYGMTLEQYQALYQQQGGLCASCGHPETRTYKGKVRNLAVDHCHSSGSARGLLCHDCNTALGLLREDPARITALLRYVHEWAS